MPDPPPASRHRGPIAQHIWGDGLLAYATALQQLRCLYEHLPRVLFYYMRPPVSGSGRVSFAVPSLSHGNISQSIPFFGNFPQDVPLKV